MSTAAQKRARKSKNEKAINTAAESVAGLSPLVGVTTEDLTEAIKTTSKQVVRHPIMAAKHVLWLA